MTNEQKLQLIKNAQYREYVLNCINDNGTTLVECAYSGELTPIDDIVLIDYNGETNLPVSKESLDNAFIQCDDCGKWLLIDDHNYVTTYDGDHFCDDCEYDNVFWCDYHEQYERYPDDARTVYACNGNTEQWCESAVEYGAFWCYYNEEYYSNDFYDSEEVFNQYGEYETWERYTARDNAYYCDECGCYFTESAYDFEAGMCDGCASESHRSTNPLNLLKSYHTSKNNNTLQFYGESKYVNPVGLGFELEIDTTYSNAQENQGKLLLALHEAFGDRLTYETDGSLENGFEIISAPHTKSEMYLVDWTKMLELCREHGYTSHDNGNCGLHFHVSGYMFGATKEKQYDTIAKVIAFYEYHYNEFVKISRRDDYHAGRWAGKYGLRYTNMEEYKTGCLNIVKRYATGWDNDRYKAINLTNRSRDGLFKTVEFRINRGTLNPNTFYASFDMILQLIKNAKKISWDDPNFFEPKKWFSGCKANTYAYIVKRGAFDSTFYVPQANNETEYTQENV